MQPSSNFGISSPSPKSEGRWQSGPGPVALGMEKSKKDLLERVLDFFSEMRQRREHFESRPEEVEAILCQGAEKARAMAAPVLDGCRLAAGLGS